MPRAKLFKEADLARALRVMKAAGIEIGRVKFDADGGFMVESCSPGQRAESEIDEVQAALDDLDRKNAARRAARLASGQNQARGR